MRTNLLTAIILATTSLTLARPDGPPATAKKPHTTAIHGLKLEDPYFWLRNRDSDEVITHLTLENDYAKSIMSGTEDLQKKLYNEILGRIKQTDMAVPYPERGYWYYSRTQEGKAYPFHCRRKGSMDGAEEMMIDVNALAEGKPFMIAFPLAVSPDNKTLAWAQDLTGARRFIIRFRDLATGKDGPDTIKDASTSFAWASDSATYYYITVDHAVRPFKVWRSKVGGGGESKPQLLHEEKDERFGVNLERTRSDSYILMNASSQKASEVWTLRADDLAGSFKVVEPRAQNMEYSLDHQGDQFFILHNNDEKSLNFQLDSAPVSSPARANWKNVIPHRDDTYLTGVDAFKLHLVITQRRNGLPEIRIRQSDSEHIVDQSETSYAVFPSTNREYDTGKFRFSYTSPITPSSVFEYDLDTRNRRLLKEQPVPTYDRTRYQVERVYAAAPDGEEVPMTILSLKGTPRDGSAPALLHSYGSYGASSDATFNSANFSLVDRGFVYAVANIRGGSEKGRAWYEAGRMHNKKNTFSDFITCADYLVTNRYTSPKKLAIRGGSAGGLLMGAVINMRPDLFAVCIADVPFVDVINSMLDDKLPLTVSEFEQWGNPKLKPDFDYMITYSPYDNVAKHPYPAILSMTGLHDSQVCYWEPAKWVAKLRDNTTTKNPIVLKINMDAGHGGHTDRYKAIEDNAYRFAFILSQLGIKD